MKNIAKKLCTCGVVLSLSMSVAPMAMAKPLNDYVSELTHITGDDINSVINQSIEVDSNIQLKSSDGVSAYEEQKIISTSSSNTTYTFNYRADIKMDVVRNAFSNYITYAGAVIGDDDEAKTDLKNCDVSGQFTIKISGLKNVSMPDAFVNGTDMYGFVNPPSIYEEVSRDYNDVTGVFTITIKVKDGTKESTLEENSMAALSDLLLECEGISVTGTGTYVIAGAVEGYTDISNGTQKYGRVNYRAKQDPVTAENQTIDGNNLQATLQINRRGGGLGGGGSSSVGTATIIIYNEDGTVMNTIKNAGTASVDLSSINTEKKNALFGGWYSDKAYKNPITGNIVSTTTKSTIYPKYISTGDFNVEFYVDGNKANVNTNEALSVNVKENDIVLGKDNITINTDNITVTDYKHIGWFTDPECTKAFDPKTPVEKDAYQDNVIKLYTKGEKKPEVLEKDDHFAYVIGYPDGTVRPMNNISREEITTIFYRLLTDEARNAILSTSNSFPDVEEDRWSNKAISTMYNGKYVTGYEDGTFGPERPITRAEFVTIASRFYDRQPQGENVFADVTGHWAEKYITVASESQWIQGDVDGSFRPNDYITRAEAMTIINRMLNRSVDDEGLLDVVENWIDNEVGAWYYYDVLEATRSHNYERAENEVNETWVSIKENRDWTNY